RKGLELRLRHPDTGSAWPGHIRLLTCNIASFDEMRNRPPVDAFGLRGRGRCARTAVYPIGMDTLDHVFVFGVVDGFHVGVIAMQNVPMGRFVHSDFGGRMYIAKDCLDGVCLMLKNE
ncbi:MAG TPA: hypothetical protein VKR31_13940, partial [Rhizomicrobium sp.]|nr:hypothetical protein [Rhizomicrobium sp.]